MSTGAIHNISNVKAGLALDTVILVQVAAVPLAVAPGLLLYYDVTPKLVLLLAGAAAGLILLPRTGASYPGWGELASVPRGRLFLICTVISCIWLAISSTVFSAAPELSVNGTGWRRFGLLGQLAVMVSTAVAACRCAANPTLTRKILAALALPGIAATALAAAQYFGCDPLLQPDLIYDLFADIPPRPYATMGHAAYLGTYLAMAVFAGLTLAVTESGRWKQAGAAAAAICFGGVLLTGTRGALLGLVAGLAAWRLWDNRRISWRRAWIPAAVIGAALVLFAVSPAGERLRNRVGEWAGDFAGGTRLWLWRDCLRMAAAKPVTGSGAETFSILLPTFQSDDLARRFPDSYHESAHNIFLDVMLSQGLLGVLPLAGALVAAMWGGGSSGAPMLLRAMLVANLVAQQFSCLTLTTAYLLYLNMALLVSRVGGESAAHGSLPCRILRRLRLPEAAAAGLAAAAVYFLMSDRALAETQRLIEGGKLAEAARRYAEASDTYVPGPSADLWFSRTQAHAAQLPSNASISQPAWREAKRVGMRAAQKSETRHGAWYHLATMYAMEDDAGRMEACLRASIQAAPAWFKPRWMLARLLMTQGRSVEAGEQKRRAEYLAAGKYPEVEKTLGSAEKRPVPHN